MGEPFVRQNYLRADNSHLRRGVLLTLEETTGGTRVISEAVGVTNSDKRGTWGPGCCVGVATGVSPGSFWLMPDGFGFVDANTGAGGRPFQPRSRSSNISWGCCFSFSCAPPSKFVHLCLLLFTFVPPFVAAEKLKAVIDR